MHLKKSSTAMVAMTAKTATAAMTATISIVGSFFFFLNITLFPHYIFLK